MKRWKVSSHYGTLSVSRIVEAETAEEAWNAGGIAELLRANGYEVEVDDDAGYEVVEVIR